MKKNWILWTLAALITLFAAIYQRSTGPTYPKKCSFSIEGKEYNVKLKRSHAGTSDAKIQLIVPNADGQLFYHRFPLNEPYTIEKMQRSGDTLFAFLPNQPKAGKLKYYAELTSNNEVVTVPNEQPVIIRFRGDVPAWVMIPHILFIFMAMLFSNFTGLLAIGKGVNIKKWTWITLIFLLIGGMIFGPILQKFAFDAYWTGFPFGKDLTDNKTLLAFIAWGFALAVNLKYTKKWPVILASIITFAIFIIPHSLMGSELDHETGQVVTGAILPKFFLLF